MRHYDIIKKYKCLIVCPNTPQFRISNFSNAGSRLVFLTEKINLLLFVFRASAARKGRWGILSCYQGATRFGGEDFSDPKRRVSPMGADTPPCSPALLPPLLDAHVQIGVVAWRPVDRSIGRLVRPLG